MVTINRARFEKNFEALSQFGKDKDGGWSRFTFGPEYMKAREFLTKLMEDAGFKVRVDAAGNLIGRVEGLVSGLPAVSAGSHIDTVKNGGKFDGNFGVMGAIEAIQTIKENKIKHNHPLEVIVFVEEEGSRFATGCFGSAAMLGKIDKQLFSRKDIYGNVIADVLREAGLDPDKFEDAIIKPGDYKAFFEMHIEQGSVLETNGILVGVVEGIAAPVWLKLILKGRADHAGATPMNLRRDALCAASEIALATERIAKEVSENTVATVGKVIVNPGGVNIVPGHVEMYFDVRDVYIENRNKAEESIKKTIESVCKLRNIEFSIEQISEATPVILPSKMTDLIEEALKDVGGISYMRMISGAGHDAQLMAQITDVGMIFAPSKDGLSHSPEEWTSVEDMGNCIQVLLQAMLKIA